MQLEKNRCFRNIEDYKYLFLGKRPVDKLKDLTEKVIIARDLENNIEDEKALYDYTGWYALIKNNLISGDFFVVVQYDCFLKEGFEETIEKILKKHPNKFIGFQPNLNFCNFWIPEQFSHALAVAAKEVYNLDIIELVDDAYNKGDTIWAGGGTFAGSKKWLENFINWVEPMKKIILQDKMAAHSIERSIKIFNIVHDIQEVYLPEILEHIFNCSHDQIYQPDEMRGIQQNRFYDFINGKLFNEKKEVKMRFFEKIFSLKNIDKCKLLTVCGLKILFKSKKLQIRYLEAEKAYLNSEIYKRERLIYDKERKICELLTENKNLIENMEKLKKES